MFPKLCGEPGCRATTTEGAYCAEHRRTNQRRYDRQDWRAEDHRWYQSASWLALRKAYLATPEGCCCQRCGAFTDLEVHHVVPRKAAPDRALDPTNLETLCGACHRREHNRRVAGRYHREGGSDL